jgi:hypothetical protein
MVSEVKGGDTVLTGRLEDRSAVFGVVAQIEALGLELLDRGKCQIARGLAPATIVRRQLRQWRPALRL